MKQAAKAARFAAAENTFEAISREPREKKRREEKAARRIKKLDWLSRVANAGLGARGIDEISAVDILQVLRPIDARGKYETAKKLRGFIGGVAAQKHIGRLRHDQAVMWLLFRLQPSPGDNNIVRCGARQSRYADDPRFGACQANRAAP